MKIIVLIGATGNLGSLMLNFLKQKDDVRVSLLIRHESISKLEKGRDETLQSIKDQRNKYKEAYDISSSIVRTAEQGLKKMENNMRNYEQYRKNGLINNDQLTNQMSLYYQQENSVLSIKNQNIQNALQIKNLEREVQIQTSEYDSRI